jgi:hypothetical protein
VLLDPKGDQTLSSLDAWIVTIAYHLSIFKRYAVQNKCSQSHPVALGKISQDHCFNTAPLLLYVLLFLFLQLDVCCTRFLSYLLRSTRRCPHASECVSAPNLYTAKGVSGLAEGLQTATAGLGSRVCMDWNTFGNHLTRHR